MFLTDIQQVLIIDFKDVEDDNTTTYNGGKIMAFERYTKTNLRMGKPQISIWSRGQIGFNSGAIEKYKLNNFNYAVLFFDKNTRAIGVMLTNDKEEPGAMKLVKRKSGGFSFSAQSFLKHYEIDYSKTIRHDLTYDEKENMYTFQLKQ